MTTGRKVGIGLAVGGALVGAAIVGRIERWEPSKLMPPVPPPRPTAAISAAEPPSIEAGQLWRLVGPQGQRRPPSQVANATNYVQGPQLIRHSGSAWSLLVNAGYCCDVPLPWGPGFEGIARLTLPGGAWEWLAVCNDWGATPRDEHELAFPAYHAGRISYTATHWGERAKPPHERARVSALTGSWGSSWTRPDESWLAGTGHWNIGIVEDQATGRQWLYTRETDDTGSQRIVRRQIMPTGVPGSPKSTSWRGYPADMHPSITDVVRSGGVWYALEEVSEWPVPPWAWYELAEWRSVAQTHPVMADVGVVWEPTGRRIRPGVMTAWDPGFARTESGDLAGQYIVHMCGDGRGPETGAWELCVWQPVGATIPTAIASVLTPVTEPLPTRTPAPTLAPEPTSTPGGSPTPTATHTPTVGPPTATPGTPGDAVLVYRLPEGHEVRIECEPEKCEFVLSDIYRVRGPLTVRVIPPTPIAAPTQ